MRFWDRQSDPRSERCPRTNARIIRFGCSSVLVALLSCSKVEEAPFIVVPPTAPVEQAYACDATGWASQLTRLQIQGFNILPIKDVTLGASEPHWTTDEWIFGVRKNRPWALQMPGRDLLATWAEVEFSGKGIPTVRIGVKREGPEARFDQGGNLMASPPIPGRWPQGRIIVGRNMAQAIKDFFRAQRAQTGSRGELIEIDTSWLKVGHVDELVAFLPGPAGKPFRIALPDPLGGLKLLSHVPVERVLFSGPGAHESAGRISASGPRFFEDLERDFGETGWKYVRIVSGNGAGQVARIHRGKGNRASISAVWDLRGPSPTEALRLAMGGRCEPMPVWFEVPDLGSRYVVVSESRQWHDGAGDRFPAIITAGELAGDGILLRAALACAEKITGEGGMRSLLLDALGVKADDIVQLPLLFAADREGRSAFPLLPNPVNLVTLNREVLLLGPCGPRRHPPDDQTDVFLRAWRQLIEVPGVGAHFVDGWDALHRFGGDAHCGTNVVRRWPP